MFAAWGQYPKAVEHYEKSLEFHARQGMCGAKGNPEQPGDRVLRTGASTPRQWSITRSLWSYKRKTGDVRGEGDTLNNLGVVFADWGQYPRQWSTTRSLWSYARKTGDVRGEGQYPEQPGDGVCGTGASTPRQWSTTRSLWSICRKTGDVRGEGQTLNNLGNVFKDWGQYPKAVEHYEKSLELSRKTGDVRGEGQTLNNLGLVYQDLGRIRKALANFQKGA